MTGKKFILGGAAGLAVVTALSVWAITASPIPVRTTVLLTGVAQRPLTQRPTIDVVPLSGGTLVNLAMGRRIGATNFPEQVLALTVACDLTTANLVIFDQSVSNTIATVATNVSFDFVQSQILNPVSAPALGSTNALVRFVARLQILPSGSSSNALLGGVLTVAGRAHRDTGTGCLAPVPVRLDFDQYDPTLLDKIVPNGKDKVLAANTARTGLAHVVGVLDIVADYLTNTVLIPAGNINIRRSAEIIK